MFGSFLSQSTLKMEMLDKNLNLASLSIMISLQ